MTKPATFDLELVPADLRLKWERQHARLKEQVAKLEILLNATGGMPSPKGEPSQNPKPAIKPAVRKTRRASRRKAIKRGAKPQRVVAPGAPSIGAPAPPAGDGAVVSEAPEPAATANAVTPSETWGTRHKPGTWTASILKVVNEADHPLPYGEVKLALGQTDIAPLLQKSEKGFYGAVLKLATENLIVRYKAHLFSLEGFRKFQEDLAAGRVRDLRYPNIARHSPMGDAIADMMKSRQSPAESGHIRWFLCKNPDFAAQLEKNPTHLYNVLARLVTQRVLKKNANGKLYQYAATKDEAPPESKSGGAPTSSGGDGPRRGGQGAG